MSHSSSTISRDLAIETQHNGMGFSLLIDITTANFISLRVNSFPCTVKNSSINHLI